VNALACAGVWDVLEQAASVGPTHAAIVEGTTTTSYRSLLSSCAALADRFQAGGIVPGTRVALPLANRAEDVARLLALAGLGAEVLLVDPAGRPGEIQRLLDLFRADCVVSSAGPTAHGNRPRRAPAAPARRVALVTSGVNGVPKVVRRDWPTALANAAAFAGAARYTSDDGILVTTPLHHSYAFSTALLAGLMSGAALHLTPTPASPAALVTALRDARVTVLQSVPFLYRCLLDVGIAGRPARLRTCVTAGEVCPLPLRRRWAAAVDRPLLDHYGTTEAAMVTFDPIGGGRGVGWPLAGVSVQIRDEATGAVAPPGSSGELSVRVRGRASTYCGQPELQRRSASRGWFHTGDIGRIEPDGHVVIESRRSRRINVAGNKVDPVEVEHALLAHPAIRECAVAGRPGAAGQEVCAYVVASEDLALASVRRFLAARLSGHKLPSHLVKLQALPKTASGKVRLGLLPVPQGRPMGPPRASRMDL
jgi:acyl-coenzyme A synthetase/AMP-(fatty) acid ligase